MNTRTTLYGSLLTVGFALSAPSASGYTLWQYDAGRNDYSSHYDLAGYAWPSGSGAIYDFGKIGTFASLPTGVSNSWLSNAVNAATSDWENWGNIDFAATLGDAGTGKVRLATADLGTGTPAETGPTPGGSTIDYATITFNNNATFTTNHPWTETLFTGVLKHELGHVLGLGDLYDFKDKIPPSQAEEFVDHPVGITSIPDRTASARQDNIMAGDINWYDSGKLVIDNDEIAGLTWLWSGKYNQIVTGDLGGWNSSYFNFRDTEPHHGIDPNNVLGWWDYRGSIVSPRANGEFPYIDLEFPGYVTFVGNAYGSAPWSHISLGNGTERFIIEQSNWTGNFDLWVKSTYTQEKRINAWVRGEGFDQFILSPNLDGLAFKASAQGNSWATVFGPLPEPPTIVLIGFGIVGLGISCNLRRSA